jgi:hypothetical protein
MSCGAPLPAHRFSGLGSGQPNKGFLQMSVSNAMLASLLMICSPSITHANLFSLLYAKRRRRALAKRHYEQNPMLCPACTLYRQRDELVAQSIPPDQWPSNLHKVRRRCPPLPSNLIAHCWLLPASILVTELKICLPDPGAPLRFLQPFQCKWSKNQRETTGIWPWGL